MNENIDLAIMQLKENIINTINDAKMPPSIIYYVLKDIYEELAVSYQAYIKQEKQRIAAQKEQVQEKQEQTDNSAGQS